MKSYLAILNRIKTDLTRELYHRSLRFHYHAIRYPTMNDMWDRSMLSTNNQDSELMGLLVTVQSLIQAELRKSAVGS